MYDHYPGSESKFILGSQFAHQLNEQLLQTSPEIAAQSDPHELVDMIRQLPNTVGVIRQAIVKPGKPYDHFAYRYPSTTLEVCGATIGVTPDFHNSEDIGYLPPDPESGAYTKTRAVVFDNARTEWAHAPVVSFRYDKLSHDQAATLWALAQPQQVRGMF